MSVIKLDVEELSVLSDGVAILEKAGITLGFGKLVLVMSKTADPIWDAVQEALTDDGVDGVPSKLYIEYNLSKDILYILEKHQLSIGHGFDRTVLTADGMFHTVYLTEDTKTAVVPSDAQILLATEDDVVTANDFEEGKQGSDGHQCSGNCGGTCDHNHEHKEAGVAESTIIEVLHDGGDVMDKSEEQFNQFLDKVESLPDDVVIVVYSAGSASEYTLACKGGPEAGYRWLANKMEYDVDDIIKDSRVMSKLDYFDFLVDAHGTN